LRLLDVWVPKQALVGKQEIETVYEKTAKA